MEGKGTYHDGLTARAINCDINLTGSALSLYLDNENKTLLIWNVESIVSCQFNGSILHLGYGQYPHQTLECSGETAKEIYRLWSGKNVIQQAEGFLFTKKLTVVWVLVGGFVALLLVSYFFLLPWAGEKAADMIPLSTEEELGNHISEMYKQQQSGDDSADYYINDFVRHLKFSTPYTIHVTVVESKEINAFALPGGNIFVYSALIYKMNSYEELAALLGHEMTHVMRRHSLRSICRSAAAGFFIAALFGDVTGISAGVLSQADRFKQLQYSRELEAQADNEGYALMINNGINPQGMADLLKLLKKENAEMPGMMKYLSTHPDTDWRIENVESKIKPGNTYTENKTLKKLFEQLKRRLNKYM